MVKCKWCNMESKDHHVCEWCKRPIAPPSGYTPTTPSSGPTVPVSPPGSTPTVPPSGMGPPAPTIPPGSQSPTAPTTLPGGATPMASTPPPMSQPSASPYGAPQADATGPVPVRILYEYEKGTPYWIRLEKFLGAAMPLAAVNVAVLLFSPALSLWSNLVFFFVIGTWLPISGAIKHLDDEDYRESAVALMLSFVCLGPLATLILFGLAHILLSAILKTDINWSVLGLLLVYVVFDILFRITLTVAGFDDFDLVTQSVMVFSFVANLPVAAIFAGWFFGGFFQPVESI